ncbi:MAG: LptA/OstA family protein [Thermodesulfobacteriota bacterium]|nr:LptA/OstA family protein [Thermodesulfobacteriota bacterium]
MRILQSNLARCLVWSVLYTAFLFQAPLITLMITRIGYADDRLPVDTEKNKQRIIHINADKLISNMEDGWAQFTGNVRVTGESLSMKSDSLKIYYNKLFKGKSKPAEAKEMIDKIIATGHVHIKSDELVAISSRAIYTKQTGTIMLSGHGSKVISGQNSIAGSQIILYMDKEGITVTGSGNKRVEAEFQGN